MLSFSGSIKVFVAVEPCDPQGVSAWMFDPVVCAEVKAADGPLIECAALVELSVLLEKHEANARTCGHGPTRKEPCNEAASET